MADIYQPLSDGERTLFQKLGINGDVLGSEFWSLVRRQLEQTPPAITAASLSGLAPAVNDLLPWTIDINVYMTAIANTNWDTFGFNTGAIGAAFKVSSGAQNDDISWDISVAAGTWTVELMHVKASDRGIYTVALDQTGTVGTVDGYQAIGTSYNQRSQITGIVVAATGKQRLTLRMKTQNASSSSYVGAIQAVQLRRTA